MTMACIDFSDDVDEAAFTGGHMAPTQARKLDSNCTPIYSG